MYRVICAVIVGLMAIRIRATARSSQRVTASSGGMALRALHRSVQAREWESGGVVVEGRIRPQDRVVAGVASLRESGSDVIRHAAA